MTEALPFLAAAATAVIETNSKAAATRADENMAAVDMEAAMEAGELAFLCSGLSSLET
jgi:hypothetical protein